MKIKPKFMRYLLMIQVNEAETFAARALKQHSLYI